MSACSDVVAAEMEQATGGLNAARFNAGRIRELVKENRELRKENKSLRTGVSRLLRDIRGATKRQKIEVSKHRKAISDFNAAFMEWMPTLRNTGDDVAQNVAAAMREFKGEMEGRFNGRSS